MPSGTEVGFIDRKKLERYIGRGGVKEQRRMVIVCGPEGCACDPPSPMSRSESDRLIRRHPRRMINVVAGPRGRNFSQGPVGGILKELGYTEREVIKL